MIGRCERHRCGRCAQIDDEQIWRRAWRRRSAARGRGIWNLSCSLLHRAVPCLSNGTAASGGHAARRTRGQMRARNARSTCGNPAIPSRVRDRWLCVPVLRQVCSLSHGSQCATLRQHVKAKHLEGSHTDMQSAVQREIILSNARNNQPAALCSHGSAGWRAASRSLTSATVDGRASTKPCAISQPRSRRKSSCSRVSTPSAITCLSSACAM